MDTVAEIRAKFLRRRKLVHVVGFLIGLLVGAFVVFQIFFLARVLPHGGI